MPNILIVDDTPEILAANVSHLTEQGFDVTAAQAPGLWLACGGSAAARSEAGKGTSIILTFLRGKGVRLLNSGQA